MRLLVVLCLAAVALFAQNPVPSSEGITRQTVEVRLSELEKGRAQALANLHAFDGAIQECQYWLDLAKKAETAKPAPNPSDPRARLEPPKPKPDAAKRPTP